MYRNISYALNRTTWEGIINFKGWDKDGNRVEKQIQHSSYLTYEVDYETKLQSVFDTYCERKYFNSSQQRNKFKTKMYGHKIFECFQPEIEYLRGQYLHDREKDEFTKHPLLLHYLDIEIAIGQRTHKLSSKIKVRRNGSNKSITLTLGEFDLSYNVKDYMIWDKETKSWINFEVSSIAEVDSSFPHANVAAFPINLITIYDSFDCEYHTWVLDGKCVKFREDSHIYTFDNEKDMMRDYLDWHNKNMPDAYVTWNGLRFDTPYMVNRAINILDKDEHLLFSPDRDIYIQEKTDGRTQEEYHRVHIKGLTQFDYLILYRDKFLYKSPNNYSLGSIGQNELGINKIELTGRLQDIWRTDFQKYYEYNVRDVEILVKMEEKLQLIFLARQICNIGLVPYEKIYATTPYLISALSMFVEEKTGRVMVADADENAEAEKFEGAFVFPVEPCYLDNGICIIDVASLYPNTMIATNLSPETKIGKLVKLEDGSYEIDMADGIKHVTKEQVSKILKTRCTLSKNNILFLKSTEKEGMVPAFLKYFYDLRKTNKKEWRKVKRKMEKCTDEEKMKDLQTINTRFDRKDFAYKVGFLNSLYGMFGSVYSSLFDLDCAEAITITGQFITRTAIDFIDAKNKELFNIDNATKSSDTDSCEKNSLVRTSEGIFTIEDFWNLNFMASKLTHTDRNHEMMPVKDKFKVLTFDEKLDKPVYNKAKRIIRRKVKKRRFKITCGDKTVIVTGDHSCMVKRNEKLVEIKAKDINPGDEMIVL